MTDARQKTTSLPTAQIVATPFPSTLATPFSSKNDFRKETLEISQGLFLGYGTGSIFNVRLSCSEPSVHRERTMLPGTDGSIW